MSCLEPNRIPLFIFSSFLCKSTIHSIPSLPPTSAHIIFHLDSGQSNEHLPALHCISVMKHQQIVSVVFRSSNFFAFLFFIFLPVSISFRTIIHHHHHHLQHPSISPISISAHYPKTLIGRRSYITAADLIIPSIASSVLLQLNVFNSASFQTPNI